ncbi:MAG: hypothetical protein IJD24_03590 [Agathobacter sp.]|nr:hypothetical protein [Agathobacter sp.]MBQ6812935.1 hypothetical protein [Agathobacter sp.]
MVAVEIVLILIGVVFLIGSFFVTERLSQKDLEQITLMSEADLKHIAEKQVKSIKSEVENSVEEIIDESLEITKRGLEKETNNKIMAVSEYSDTVMEEMNKTHNEIMFLYSMLNDKHTETADLVGDLQKYAKQIREFDMEAAMAKIDLAANTVSNIENASNAVVTPTNIEETPISDVDVEEIDKLQNKNEKILLLYKEGMSEVEIAKKLDCGLGEVRLVLGLYNEA